MGEEPDAEGQGDDERRALMHEAYLRVLARPDGQHEVQTTYGEVLAVCQSNSAAWRWIDRNTGSGQADYDRHYRIRNSERFS